MARAERCLREGWHCSEVMVIAVGGYYFGRVEETLVRAATSFAGGMGDTNLDVCGALTGGLMVIGALHGRSQKGKNDGECMQLAARYRQLFLAAFGETVCERVKADWVRRHGGSCAVLVREAAGLLVDVLEEGER